MTLLIIQLLSILVQPSFRHIGIDEGLSQLSVLAIEEDTNGFIWVGTGDGLNKFEGNKVKVYRHAYQDSTSIVDDKINNLESTVNGSILAVTKKGISCYMPQTDNFHTIKGTERVSRCFDMRKCPALIQDPSKWLLISKRNLLATVDIDTGETDTLTTDITASSFAVMDSTLYVLSRSSHIYRIDRSLDEMECIFTPTFDCHASNMSVDKNGNLLIALEDNGMILYNPDTRKYRHYTTADGLSSNLVRAIETDDNGIIWIATGNNLTLLDIADDRTAIFTHNNLEPESLSSASLKAIHKSSSGAMWIGTFYKGIDYYNPNLQNFHNIVLPESFCNNSEAIICTISADPDGFLWIGTSRSGIFKYYPEKSTFVPLRNKNAKEQALNAVAYHNNGDIVMFGCSISGLSIYDKKTDRIIWKSPNESVFSIAEYTGRKYLVGLQHGIKLFDFADMTSRDISIPGNDGSRVYYLFTDSEGLIWAGMEDMLYCGELSGDSDKGYVFNIRERFQDISQVQDIIEKGTRLWFASRSGLFCYDRIDGKWSVISDKDGISTNLVRGLEFDRNGYIFATTDRSILFVDPESLSFQEYHAKDGLVNEKFNIYANSKTEDGTIWFGGTSGITYFKPQIKDRKDSPAAPFISELCINGEHYIPDGDGINSSPGLLQLNAGKNNITMTLTNLELFSKDRIEYMMEGINNEWQSIVSKSNTVSYTNLPAGDNIFKIRAVDTLTGSKSPVYSMTIHVKCHWYQSGVFIFIICSIILLCVFWFIFHVKKLSSYQIEEILNKAKIDIQTARVSSYLTIQSMNRKRDVEFITKALRVVEDNVANDKFNIDMFAEQMNMSRSNLHIRIKSAYGASATHFIRRIRIEKAMEYLKDGKMNISEVAYSVGFSSATYFATAFKQVTGVNPTEWKLSLLQDNSKEKK